MDLTSVKRWIDVAELSLITMLTFYLLPAYIILRDVQAVLFATLLSIVAWVVVWKSNQTFHVLLVKWEWKKK